MNSGYQRAMRVWCVTIGLMLFAGLGPAVHSASAQTVAGVSGPAAFGLPWAPPATAYRITVDTDGLYALTYTDLANALLPVNTLDPRSLQLFYMGQEVPIRVLGEEDGVFNATDVVLFYGRGVEWLFLEGVLPTNKYTRDNVYWLTYGCAAGPCAGPYGARMAEVDGAGTGDVPPSFPHRERLIKSQWYFSQYPFEHDADHWFADWTTQNTATHRTYSFYAYNHTPDPLPGTLSLRLLGWGNNPHHLRVWVNNNLVIDGSGGWSGFTFYETTVAVPRNLFVEGLNRIRVGIALPPGVGTDMVYLDWWDLTYYDTYVAENNLLVFDNPSAGTWQYDVSNFATPDIEVYDVTDFTAPRRIINTAVSPAAPHSVGFGATADGARRYLALTPAAWRTPLAIERAVYPASLYSLPNLLDAQNGADYILIAHRDFWSQAETLVSYRDREFRAVLVDVQQIYDQFNGGMMSAEAIRDFLAYAHANWSGTPPAYVLLMGDGTNDMRKYRTTTNTYIPPYLYLADPDLGETAADNRFVTFIGNDNIPDMHIGRFPVNDVNQAQAMVDKVMYYEIACQCDGIWDRNTIFLADDLEGGGGDFYFYSDEIADGYVDEANTVKLIPENYRIQKEYLGVTCDLGNPGDAAECRGTLINTLNRTTPAPKQGALFVSYVGHAVKEVWASENMFNKTANSQLNNGPCLPIMLAMTCYEGSFHDFETPEVLAEASVRLAADPITGQTRGSIASFSPTGFGLVTGHDYLERGLMLAWFHQGIDRLGASVSYAKQYLVDNAPANKYLDLLDTFLLLGDPALQVKTEATCLAPTAFTMSGFSTQAAEGGAQVTWQTADESDILGFNVLRRNTDFSREGSAGAYSAVNAELIPAAYMGLPQGSSYSYLDRDVRPGEAYQYQIEIIKLDGASEFYGSREFGTVGLQLVEPQTQ